MPEMQNYTDMIISLNISLIYTREYNISIIDALPIFITLHLLVTTHQTLL